MPLSTQLPAPSIEWESLWYCPGFLQNPSSYVGVGSGFFDRLTKRLGGGAITQLPSTAAAPNSVTGYSGIGIGGATLQFNGLHERKCMSCAVAAGAGNRFGSDWRPTDWLPHIGDPAECAPGSRVLPASVVGVFDWNLAVTLAGATPTWPNDSTGVFFQANEVSGDTIPGVAATADIEGVGVFLNDDGAGGSRWEYVSWAAGAPGAILERVPIVATVTDWSTIRFVFTTGASGRESALQVFANGLEVVARDFGSAFLDRLDTSTPNTTGPVNRILVGEGPDTVFYTMSARFGRFTPAGVELQGQ